MNPDKQALFRIRMRRAEVKTKELRIAGMTIKFLSVTLVPKKEKRIVKINR